MIVIRCLNCGTLNREGTGSCRQCGTMFFNEPKTEITPEEYHQIFGAGAMEMSVKSRNVSPATDAGRFFQSAVPGSNPGGNNAGADPGRRPHRRVVVRQLPPRDTSAASPAPIAGLGPEPVLPPQAPSASSAAQAPRSPTSAAPPVCLEAADGFRIIPVNTPVILGRGIATDGGISGYLASFPTVSRKHLEIWISGGSFMVRDLGSTNGTFINGWRLETEKIYPLKTGDQLRLGRDGTGGAVFSVR